MFGSRFPGFERRGSPFERHPRMFKKGDMKYVILELVKEKPSHGYELTQALEDRFHGTYSPSPGSIYPILQLLEDMGYVSSNTNEGKKVYTITDAGKKFLEDQKQIMETIRGRLHGLWDTKDEEFMHNWRGARNYLREIGHSIGYMATRQTPATKMAEISEILARTLKEIERTCSEK
jgi:DNA-binding PadR family transcriptional regulator